MARMIVILVRGVCLLSCLFSVPVYRFGIEDVAYKPLCQPPASASCSQACSRAPWDYTTDAKASPRERAQHTGARGAGGGGTAHRTQPLVYSTHPQTPPRPAPAACLRPARESACRHASALYRAKGGGLQAVRA